MTASQWFDLAVIAVAFIAAVSGWRSGAVGSLMSFVGVVLRACAGVLLAPHLVSHISGARTKLFIALFLILGLVVVGEVAGVVLGRAVRGAIRNPGLRAVDSGVGVVVQGLAVMVGGVAGWVLGRAVPAAIRNPGLRAVDSGIGVVLQVFAVMVAAWLLASPLRASDQQTLAQAFEGSMIRKDVDRIAPSWLKTVPNRLSALLNTSGITDVWQPFGHTPIVPVDAPDANLAGSAVVAQVLPSLVKIRGLANGCQKVLEGSGFVVSPNRVMSNAHVVAGANSVTVESNGTSHDAQVVSYDPNADISILDVPNLSAPALKFAEGEGKSGTDALVLGYPGGGPFVATPARIRDVIQVNGPDIYATTTVEGGVVR